MAKKKEETPDLFETPVTDAVAAVEPPKKKRGRPSKAEMYNVAGGKSTQKVVITAAMVEEGLK